METSLYAIHTYYFTLDESIEEKAGIIEFFGTEKEVMRACDVLLNGMNVVKIDVVNEFTGEITKSIIKQGW